MKLGITGTRSGMTLAQRAAFIALIDAIHAATPITNFAHGDCVGVDDQAANIVAVTFGHSGHGIVRIICHPPTKNAHRAFNTYHDEIHQPAPYLTRNRAIVDSCDTLIVVPKEGDNLHCERHRMGSGTWYTCRYAIMVKKPVVVVWPGGTIAKIGAKS